MLLRRLLAGTRTFLARIRLPIVPPTVTQLTGKDAPNRPYGELIDLGQQRMAEPPYAGRVLNVSVMGGFAYRRHAVQRPDRGGHRHRPGRRRRAGARDRRGRLGTPRPLPPRPDQPGRGGPPGDEPPTTPLIFADVADNPGGGGRGNTMAILQAFHAAGVRNALVGVIHDPALAAEAHAAGSGAQRSRPASTATAATNSPSPSPPRPSSPALRDQPIRGRRGIYANNTLDIGKSAALTLDGITVVVLTHRYQCADPMFFEAFGLDIAAARVVVVKSRGHFRGGFDEFFRHEQVIEVDAPGLTSPILSRFPWRHMPRPVLPIDDTARLDTARV